MHDLAKVNSNLETDGVKWKDEVNQAASAGMTFIETASV